MTDLIPRDALVEALRQLIGEGKEQWIQGNNSAVNACIRTVLTTPTIDPAAIREAALRGAEKIADYHATRNGTASDVLIDIRRALIGEKK